MPHILPLHVRKVVASEQTYSKGNVSSLQNGTIYTCKVIHHVWANLTWLSIFLCTYFMVKLQYTYITSTYTIHHTSYTVCHTSYILYHISYILYHISCIIHLAYVHHISCIIHQISCVIHKQCCEIRLLGDFHHDYHTIIITFMLHTSFYIL